MQEPLADKILKSLYLNERLPLVVVGAPAPYPPVGHGELERRGAPKIERLRRHDIVVGIDEHCRPRRVDALLGIDQRIALRRHHARLVGSCGQQEFAPTRRTTVDVGAMLGFGTHTGDAHQACQFVEETFLVFPDIFFDFHLLVFRVSLTYFEYCPKVRDQNVGAMIRKKRDMAKQIGTQSPSGTSRTQAASTEKMAGTTAKKTEYRDKKDKPADRRYRTAIRKNGRCDHSSWQATARTATRNSQPALNRQRSDLCTKKSKALPAVCRSPQKKS